MRQATFLLVLAVLGAEPAAAQGFGWLLGAPPPTSRRARSRNVRQTPLDVPLPPPRPHFSSDDTRPAEAARSAELKTQEPPFASASEANTTLSDAASRRGGSAQPDTPPPAPLPPEKPVELGGSPSAPGAAEATPKPEPERSAPIAPPSAATPSLSVPAPAMPPLPPEKPASLGSPTSASTPPSVAPSGANTAFNPREPAADPGCADRLKARGVNAEPTPLGPQPDARCTVAQPMRLVSSTLVDGATVSFPDKPTLACVTIDAFSAYVHDLLAPLAKGTWSTSVTSVWTGPGLECRSRDHVFGAKLSAHGQGLAVDIAQLKLGDGRLVAVGEPKTDVERGFETAARAGGCGYFHTVLGPGSDSYHRTHWHFDLEVRGREGDSKYCK